MASEELRVHERETGDSREWRDRKWLARLLRLVILLLPIGIGFLVARGLRDALGQPATTEGLIWTWTVVIVGSTATVVAVDRLTSHLLPLVTLMRLALVFPDEAPSRYSVALRSGTTRQLEQRIAEARDGFAGDAPVEVAEKMLSLMAALNHHDRLTRGHSERVRAYSNLIAEEMGLEGDELNKLRWAAMLHDVGKLEVPYEILNKKGRLTDHEFDIVKIHPEAGMRYVEPLSEWLGDWVNAVGQHHERWEGGGYPTGTAGTEISLGGRIVAVADTYDVITAARSYKKPMSPEAARRELARCAGTQFDPEVVRAFLNAGLGARKARRAGALSWLFNLPGLASAAAPTVVTAAAVTAGTLAPTFPDFTLDREGAEVTAEVTPDTPPPDGLAFTDNPSTTTTTITSSTESTTSSSTSTTEEPAATPPPATSPTSTPPPTSGSTTTSSPAATTTTTTPATAPPAAGNEPPIAVTDLLHVINTITTDVFPLANDTDPDGDAVSLVSIGTPSAGSAYKLGSRVRYTPPSGFTGTVTIPYVIGDTGGTTDGTIELTVVHPSTTLLAEDDAATVAPGTAAVIDLVANDNGVGAGVSITLGSSQKGAGLSLAGGVLTYQAAVGLNGIDRISYQLSQGSQHSVGYVYVTADTGTAVVATGFDALRSSPSLLAGRTVSGPLYAFVLPESDIWRVEFALDAGFSHTENWFPYDLNGTLDHVPQPKPAYPFDTTTLANGEHTLTVRVHRDGGVQQFDVGFEVAN
ncbi:MAG: HD domain-containing protein [Actinomycetia bacterium]|nr:HD domain-containing protein [Actinomycetes bacterium]